MVGMQLYYTCSHELYHYNLAVTYLTKIKSSVKVKKEKKKKLWTSNTTYNVVGRFLFLKTLYPKQTTERFE